MIEKTISYQNSTVFYRTAGKGKIVLFIHGFPADGTLWDNQVDTLKDHCNLIIPDLPGSGRSALIENADIDTYAEVIKLILDAEILNITGDVPTEITIIGHSMGGYITLAFAEKYPGYLNAFGLFHSTAFADSEEKKQSRSKAIGFIRDKGAGAFLKTTVPGMFAQAFTEKFPDKINELIEKGKNFTAPALIQYYEAMRNRPDRINVLKSFLKPILFIIGEHDTAIPFQSSLQQCYLPAQSHVHILDQSAHMGMWEEKDKTNNILADFLINKF